MCVVVYALCKDLGVVMYILFCMCVLYVLYECGYGV